MINDSTHLEFLDVQKDRLLAFYRQAQDARGGFHWLDDQGRPDLTKPKGLWSTCRFIHSYSLAELTESSDAAERTAHGLAFLPVLEDRQFGGWFAGVSHDGKLLTAKETYGHAFVILAAASAYQAGHNTDRLLLRALDCVERMWEPQHSLYADSADESWSRIDTYRGINANMHMVEALLAAGGAIGDPRLISRATAITRTALQLAEDNDWRLPEHFTADWRMQPDYNIERPRDPFRPYGSTVGHWLEWSRLAVQAAAASGAEDLVHGAAKLFTVAVEQGRQPADDGFVFSVNWDGQVVDADRYHWVAAEAIGAADALRKATGSPQYARSYLQFWSEAERWFIDPIRGGWWHQLTTDGSPTATVWSGKPDLYHALQATLFSRVPLGGDLASGLLSQTSPVIT